MNLQPSMLPWHELCGEHVTMAFINLVDRALHDEHVAAGLWSYLTEAMDVHALELTGRHGYSGSLAMLLDSLGQVDTGELSEELRSADEERPRSGKVAAERWLRRLRHLATREQTVDVTPEKILIPGDELWPIQLNDLGNLAPLCLWFQGQADVLCTSAISIVGSRASTNLGLRITRQWAHVISEKGIAVISGGAYGIDAAAHEGALDGRGRTAVVFANGIGRWYPASHIQLYHKILESGGVVISESPPDATPMRHRFLSRNRLIAALCQACLVTEAAWRSGALSTGHYALELGRPLGAVPGSIESPYSAGCHRLLREGATCVTSVEEALELANIREPVRQERNESGQESDAHSELTSGQSRILDTLLKTRGLDTANLALRSGLPLAMVIASVGALQARGLAEQRQGLWWRAHDDTANA